MPMSNSSTVGPRSRPRRFARRWRKSWMTSSSRSARPAPATVSCSKSPVALVAARKLILTPSSTSLPWCERTSTRPSISECSSVLRGTWMPTTSPSRPSNRSHSVRTRGRHCASALRSRFSASSACRLFVTLPCASEPSNTVPPSPLANATSVSASRSADSSLITSSCRPTPRRSRLDRDMIVSGRVKQSTR